MTIAPTWLSDQQLKTEIEQELQWRPEVDAPAVGVVVEGGTVLLSGQVRDYAQRIAVRDAVLRVRGVAALVNELQVEADYDVPSDWDLANEVRHALAAAVDVPDGIQAEVEDGRVVLTGRAAFDSQRSAAKRTVQFLRGVQDVESRIELDNAPSSSDAIQRIENALRRNAIIDAHHISVRLKDDTLVLDGVVKSWTERYQAAQAAAASPHVARVENNIVVRAR